MLISHSGGMQEWVLQIPSILILVSVLYPSLHPKYFRIKLWLLVCYLTINIITSNKNIHSEVILDVGIGEKESSKKQNF